MKTDVFCKRLNGYAKRNKKFTTEIPFFSLLKRKTVPLWSKYEGFPSVGEGSGTVKKSCLERPSKENISKMHDFGNFWGDSRTFWSDF